MPVFSRRSFIAGLSTIPFALWFEKYASAQPTLTRFNLNSQQGAAMLDIYANAVKTMMSTPEKSPVGEISGQRSAGEVVGCRIPKLHNNARFQAAHIGEKSVSDRVRCDLRLRRIDGGSDPNRRIRSSLRSACNQQCAQ